ncbi:MAG: hypothetical protein LUF26_01435 [Firmicutes bacterium]|nr:hypothetical protein [Bacillota bacterium]
MKSKRKLLSLILALSMAIGSFTALPMAASADEDVENPTVSLMADDTADETTDTESDSDTEAATFTSQTTADALATYLADDAVLSQGASTTDREVTIGGETVSVTAIGTLGSGLTEGVDPPTYNGATAGTATFTVNVETADTYDIAVYGLGAYARRVDLNVNGTIVEFPETDSSAYADVWTIVSDSTSAKDVFTYTFEGVELNAGDNTIEVGTIDDSWCPDLCSIAVYSAAPAENGIVYSNGSIKVTYDAEQDAKLIVAKYYSDGTLSSVTLDDISLIEGTVTVAYDLEDEAAKIMVWDGLDTMVPLLSLSVDGTVEEAPTPTADAGEATEAPTTAPTTEPTPSPTPKATIDPDLVYYVLDFEDETSGQTAEYSSSIYTLTLADGTQWVSQYAYAASDLSIKTDSNSDIDLYFNFTNTSGSGTRTTYYIFDDAAQTLNDDNQAVMEFDFNSKGTGSHITIMDTASKSTPIGNGNYDSTYIFNLYQTADGVAVNTVDGTNTSVLTSGYTAGNWAHVKAVMDFTNHTVTLTITSLDGNTTYLAETQVAMGSTSATAVRGVHIAEPRNVSASVSVDNFMVRDVIDGDISGVYYSATFDVDGTTTILSALSGECLESVPDTDKTGYIFNGWLKDDDTETLYSTEDVLATPLTANVKYTASYSADEDYIEPMVSLEFSSFPTNGIPTAGEDADTAADNEIAVKIVGELGTDLTANPDSRVTDLDVDWEFLGFRDIASKAYEGSDSATTDSADSNIYCDSYAEVIYDDDDPTTVNFALKSQSFNFYGLVKATVTYNGETLTITEPMAIIPDTTSDTGSYLPKAGYKYVADANNYSDDIVGYQATTSSDNKSATDIITGDWAAYGGNSGRGLYIQSDDDGKFFKLKSTGTNSSSFAVNKLDSAPTGQVIITQDVRFYNSGSSILFKQDNPVTWSDNATAISFNFTGSAFNLNGGDTICSATTGKWYTVVLSADVTSKLCYAKVYDKESGELLGEFDTLSFVNTGATAPVYLCYRTPDSSQGELDFNDVQMYIPTISDDDFTITAADTTISIPKAEDDESSTTTITAKALSTEGYDMIGEATWAFADSVTDTTGLTITPDSTDTHTATLTVDYGAPSGELPINVTIGGVTKTITLNLTSSQDSVQFTSGATSIAIPLTDGTSEEYTYAAKVVGPSEDDEDTTIDIEGKTITYSVYDKNNVNEITSSMPTGITFDAETATLTVSSDATATVIYIRATSTNRNEETITRALKVTIHGLAFDFGTSDDGAVVEGYTAVTASTTYSESAGYGIESGSPTAAGTASEDDATSDYLTGTFTFKANVTAAKVYTVTVTYSGSLTSEYVSSDLSGYILLDDDGNAPTELTELKFDIPVIDDVLDLTFSGGSVASIVIEKQADKQAGGTPNIYTIGDSTIANNGSWAYVLYNNYSTYAGDTLANVATFTNNGRGGRNLCTYYTNGELKDRILTQIRPGDYVMIGDMGTNGMGSSFEDDFNYYIDACEAMGAKVILNSYTPHGALTGGGYESGYDSDTNTFTSYRTDSYDVIVRSIYAERSDASDEAYDENVIGFVDIGKMADAAFNAYVADYETNGYESADAAAQAIIACFSDHNHYSNAILACQLMLSGYGTGDDAKGIVQSLYEIVSADLAEATE